MFNPPVSCSTKGSNEDEGASPHSNVHGVWQPEKERRDDSIGSGSPGQDDFREQHGQWQRILSLSESPLSKSGPEEDERQWFLGICGSGLASVPDASQGRGSEEAREWQRVRSLIWLAKNYS